MAIQSREDFTNLLKSLDVLPNKGINNINENLVVKDSNLLPNELDNGSSTITTIPVTAPSEEISLKGNSSSEAANCNNNSKEDKSKRLDYNLKSLPNFNNDNFHSLYEKLGCRALKRVVLPYCISISNALDPKVDHLPVIGEVLTFIDNLIRENGMETAIKVYKDLNTVTRRNILNQKVKEDFCIGGMWWDTYKVSKIPRKLPLFNKLIKENPHLAVNISNGYTVMKLKPKVDLSTVENSFTGNKDFVNLLTKELYSTASLTQKELGLPNLEPFKCNKYRIHSSLKAGPNETVSLLGAWKDAKAIKIHNNDKFLYYCDILKRPDVLDMYNDLNNYTPSTEVTDISLNIEDQNYKEKDNNFDDKKLHEAKLVFIPDKGGKTRVIFIQNYLYQELLYPLHNSMMSWLRSHPCDATFRQREVALKVKYLTNNTDVWSYDLTAATDRWPIETQLATLKGLLSNNNTITSSVIENVMFVWYDLMKTKPWVEEANRLTYYSVGQPMGSYCSWPAMAITHHMICELIRLKLSIESRPWYILGDDIVIYHKDMARLYKEIILDMGMNISENKSYVPENQVVGHSAEFAKYIFCDGVEYTPFSPIAFDEIYSQHQWWKFIDLVKWSRDTLGTSVILNETNQVEVSEILDTLLNLLFKKDKDKVLLILSFPEINEELTPLEPRKEDKLVVYPNDWKQSEGAHLSLLMHKLELVGESVAKSFSQLMRLKTELGSGELQTTKGYGLEVPLHPLNTIVKDLDQCILDISRTIDQQSSHKDAIDLLTDVSLIRDVLVKGRKLSMWDRDNRSSGLKSRDHMVIELHKLMYPKTVVLTEDDLWEF